MGNGVFVGHSVGDIVGSPVGIGVSCTRVGAFVGLGLGGTEIGDTVGVSVIVTTLFRVVGNAVGVKVGGMVSSKGSSTVGSEETSTEAGISVVLSNGEHLLLYSCSQGAITRMKFNGSAVCFHYHKPCC